MRKLLPLFLFLFVIVTETKADCNPAFTVSVNQNTVTVQAINNGPHLLHNWIFSGAWLNGPSASFTYCLAGTYSISHWVYDSLNNCQDSTRQTVVIAQSINLSVSFTVTRDNAHPDQCVFQSTSTTNGGQIDLYTWTLDGYIIYTGSNPSFAYPVYEGSHDICLYVRTVAGCYAYRCDTINVPRPPCNLTASFTYAAPSHPRQINFIAAPASTTFIYQWFFGDGYGSYQQNPIHTYSQPGNYDVILRIYDPVHTCFDTAIQNITIHGTPADSCTASFTYSADSSHPNQVHFTAGSNQTITSQTWIIYGVPGPYDSIIIHSNDPGYTFSDTGYYYVCLYITTNTGCTRAYCEHVGIYSMGGRTANRLPSFPNPATTMVSLRIKLDRPEIFRVTVYNLSGYTVYQTQRQGMTGSNEIAIPVQQLNSGQYFIDIQYGDQRKRSIFQKL
jgi:hypothetical protein